ncbi:transforming acidic coiled-coil-containing protein 3-like isoform X2 [Macrobrachium rosenbergii]|uniref:transforming acidic coiled-coil-containing protein 3-like isoform X2 n=1 Tax=Macrobrachium rosenbergii TaxID=79674 RepID=UPI0034D414F3
MSETENVAPRDMQGQLNKVKDTSKMNVDSKTMRTPFKDIGNKSSCQIKSPLKGKLATPSKFEAIQSLDDDENWRDRTEVVTKLEHTTYKMIAREIVDEVIEKLPGMSESHQTVPELKVAKMTFREQPSSNMDDSVLDLDDTISLPQLDETISLPRVESRLNVPVANSTLVNTSSTSPGAPDQSDTVFENSLLSSFEKMQIKGVKGAVVDEDDDDIFHDASDDIDSFSASPVRDQNLSTKQPVEQLNDPLDMLMSCMEKITVQDEDQRNLAGKDVCVDSVERAQLLFNNTKGMPSNREVLQISESDVRSLPVVDAENEVNGEKKNFSDPDFNPFLIGTSTGSTAEPKKNPDVSPLGVKPKVDKKNLPRKSESEATENNVLEGNRELRETVNEINSNHSDTPLSQSTSPNTETLPVKENTSAVNLTSGHKPESEELQHRSYNLETAQDHKFECSSSQNTDINFPSHVVQEDDNTSQVMMPKPDSEEAAIAPPKVSYDLDRILKCCDDPTFNPFASKSFVVNSPDLQADLQDKEFPENSNNFDYSVNGLQPITENLPSEKKYSLEAAFDSMKDPEFDPFLSKSLIINSPDLIDKDDAPKDHDGNVAKSESVYDSKTSVCKIDHLEAKNMPDNLVATEASTESTCFIANTASVSDEFSMRSSDDTSTIPPVSQDTPEVISPKRKYDEAFVGEMEDCDEELLVTREATGPSEEVNEEDVDVKTSGQETEEPISKMLQVEEMTPPKKGYNLDSIDSIDDNNFNPFATKTSVTNTPSKNSEFLSADTSKKDDPDIADKVELKATSSCKKGVSEPNISISEITKNTKQASEVNFNSSTCKPFNNENNANSSELCIDSNKDQDKEDIPVPKKVYQLDFLDNLDDPSFNPFATKSSVMNSPGNGSLSSKSDAEANEEKKSKGEATATAEEKQCAQSTKKTDSSQTFEGKEFTQMPEEKISMQISEESETSQTSEDKVSSQTTEAGEKSGTSKPKVIKKAMKPTLKKRAPVVKSKVEETGVNSNEKEEKDISLAKKAYHLDFLDNLDDPSFNPFASKSSVANSPAKLSISFTAQGQEAVDSEASCKPETKNKVENLQEPSSSVLNSKQESKVDMKDGDISVPGKDCKLDGITDPSHSLFSSDASVADTSKKVSFAASDRDSALRCPRKSKEGNPDKDEEVSNDTTVKSTVSEPAGLGPRESCSRQLSSKPVSSVSDSMFESITKEAMRLVAEVTPKKQLKDKKIVQASAQARQRDVFSPQFAQSGVSEDPSVYNFEEFINATDFFSNPGDLDALSEHGKDGDKLNLVRNSLYVKFDPLVSGRQSLAPYLVQQKVMQKEEPDPRRSSALMCFSPSPDKTQRGGEAKGTGTPVRPLLKTQADETLVMDATANMTLNDATVCEGHNTTVVAAASSSTAFNTTIISQGGNFHDDTIFQEPAVPGEKMIPEREMLKKIKEIEQTAHLVMQDKLLRQSRVLEEVNRKMKKQMEESEIALAELEQENSHLRSAIQHLQCMLKNVVEQGEKKIKEAEREHLLMENKYDLECKALKEEVQQHQEELKKVEGQFSDLIKKYMRTQELTETMRKNEEVLKTEKEALRAELVKKKESFAIILKTLEEKFNEAQQEFLKEREKHEHENAKLIVLGKKAEVKILSLTETVEKKTKEIQRLTALIDDITSKFG